MKQLPVLVCVLLLTGLAGQANAGKHKKKSASPPSEPPSTGETVNDEAAKAPEDKKPLDFDFFGGQPGTPGEAKDQAENRDSNTAGTGAGQKAHTRRWMLQTHQTLGMATWVLLAGTVVVGQLNYNQLYGGGGGSQKWQKPHQILVLSTSLAFAATAAFAIFAPTPYDKPLQFDTGLVHRIAAIGATLGMVTEGVLGWIATHQANTGNSQHLATMARTHQIVGYATLGCLTIAGTVWLF